MFSMASICPPKIGSHLTLSSSHQDVPGVPSAPGETSRCTSGREQRWHVEPQAQKKNNWQSRIVIENHRQKRKETPSESWNAHTKHHQTPTQMGIGQNRRPGTPESFVFVSYLPSIWGVSYLPNFDPGTCLELIDCRWTSRFASRRILAAWGPTSRRPIKMLTHEQMIWIIWMIWMNGW